MFDLIPQSTIQAEIRTRLRDEAAQRWNDGEVYAAMNSALMRWRDKVSIQQAYALDMAAGTRTYTLPVWISPPFRVTLGERRDDASSWTVEPGTGGYTLRMTSGAPDSEATILWNLRNGPVPLAIPVLSSGIDDDDTSLTIAATPEIPAAGYVRIGSEIILYKGYSTTSSTTTLLNLERGILSTAASHLAAAKVQWCVAVPSSALLNALYDETRLLLHEMFLSNAAPKERDFHQQMIGYYGERVDKFWGEYHDPIYTGRVRPVIIDHETNI